MHRKRYCYDFKLINILFLCIFFSGCKRSNEPNIAVSAVMSDIVHDYVQYSNVSLNITVASASVCAKQIENGSSAGIFFSSNKKWIDYLVSKDLIDKQNVFPLFKNKLIFAVHKNELKYPERIEDLREDYVTKISLADHTNAPAGMYAKKILEKEGVWDDIYSKIVLSATARATFSNIQTRSIYGGIIWNTFLYDCSNIRSCFELTDITKDEVVFYCAVIKGYEKNIYIKKFLSYLYTDNARITAEKYGYEYILKGDGYNGF